MDRAVSVDEALGLIGASVRRMPAERVPLAAAAGRRLASQVVAPSDLWPFARAAMDGFAVRACDLAGAAPDAPVPLRVTETLWAGRPAARVGPGEAVRIMTGAVVPEGADAVVPLEQVEEGRGDDGTRLVWISRALPAGANLFPPGEDARAGQVVLPAGHILGPSAVGLLSALGITQVEVYRRPRAAVVAIGDELVSADSAVGAGERSGCVFDSNSLAMAAGLESLGAAVTRLGIVPDQPGAIREAVLQGLEFDLLVMTGGASVGDRDLTLRALREAGAEVVFDQLLVKPGRRAGFARLGDCLVFALPGSPGAAMNLFLLLVAPAVRAMAGAPDAECQHPRVKARLMRPVQVSPGRPHYVWGRLALCRRVPAVWPVGPASAAVLRAQALANALIEVPADAGRVEAGEAVTAVWFGPAASFPWLPVPAVSVVGAHKSGKTTVMEAVISELSRRGLRVAALKHDVHGFQMDREGKDTWRMGQAGARTVAISGAGRSAVLWHGRELDLEELIPLVGEGASLLLVEGYKSAGLPRVEVVAEGQEPQSPPQLLLAAVTRAPRPDRPGWLDAADARAIARVVEDWLRDWDAKAARTAGVE